MFHHYRLIAAGILLAASPSAVLAGNQSTTPVAPPPGTYQQSCLHIAVQGTTLTAQCFDAQGYEKSAQLKNYARANGQDIANCNGVLTIGSCPARH